MNTSPLLVVGLGNPGEQYKHTRHNVGFWLVELLAKDLGSHFKTKTTCNAEIAEGSQAGRKIVLLKPTTFMNKSGIAVVKAVKFFNIDTAHILALHDELDFDIGKVRLKCAGGHAGHNGLRDVHKHLGSDAYWRLRIGIGRPSHSNQVSNYVLQVPKQAERGQIEQGLEDFVQVWQYIVQGDFDTAMQVLHTQN